MTQHGIQQQIRQFQERGRFGSILGALDANEKRLGDQSLQARAANQRIEEALSVMNQANRLNH